MGKLKQKDRPEIHHFNDYKKLMSPWVVYAGRCTMGRDCNCTHFLSKVFERSLLC